MALKVQDIKVFSPRGERYIRHNPHLADSVGTFEEVDFSAFLLNNDHSPRKKRSAPKTQSYHISFSGNRGKPPVAGKYDEVAKSYQSLPYQTFENQTADIEEELYIVGSTLVWSRGDQVIKSFNFDQDKQHIRTALIGWFPYDEDLLEPTLTNIQGLPFRQTSQLATAPVDSQRKLTTGVVDNVEATQSPLKRRYTNQGFDISSHMDNGSRHGEQPYSLSYSSKKTKSDLSPPFLALTKTCDEKKLQKAICIVLKDIAKIHFISGHTFSVHLPFPVHTGRAMDVGVILERRQGYQDLKSNGQGARHEHKDSKPTGKGVTANAPLLVIIHPREEPTVLSVTDTISYDMAKKELRLTEPISPLADENHELKFVTTCDSRSDESRLLVTYHKKEMSHYIWRYASHVYDNSTSSTEKESSTLARKEELIRAANEAYHSPTTTPVKQTGKRNIRQTSSVAITSTPPKPTTPPPLTRKDSFVQYHDDLSSETDFLHTSEYADSSFERRNHSGAYIELLWSEKRTTRSSSGRTTDKSTEVFMAHDLDGSELVCIHDNHSNTLIGINVTALVNVRRGRGVKAFEFKASAAQPIRATRHNYYDILLVQNGKVKLWIGSGTVLVDISLPNNIHDLDAGLNSPPDHTKRKELRTLVRQLSISEETLLVTELKDPTHNKINITMSNSRTYRITVDFTPKSRLVQDCLMALSFAVPINVFQSIRQRFMYHQYSEEWKSEAADSVADEWDHFASAIFCFLHGDEMERGELLSSLENENVPVFNEFLDQPAYSNLLSGLNLGDDIQGIIGHQSDNETSQAQYSMIKKWIHKSLESYEKRKPEESLVSNITSVVLGLHLIWEDLRLDKYRKQDTMNMGLLLIQLATILQWDEWKIYYIDSSIPDISYDHPDVQNHILSHFPPDFGAWVQDHTQGVDPSRGPLPPFPLPQDLFPYPGMMANPILRKRTLCLSLQRLASIFIVYSDPLRDASSVVLLLISVGFNQGDLAKLPNNISKPIYDMLESYKSNPPADWPVEAYNMIGREDIAEQIKGESQNSANDLDIDATHVNDRRKTHMLVEEALAFESEMIYGYSDEDLSVEHQTHLTNLSHRTLALGIGRGILSFGTCQPDPTKAFPIAELVLSAKVLPMRTVVQFDISTLPKDYLDWPAFHNGVAAGMRISPDVPVNGSWILYNKPEELNPSHGGFLLALGLTGHLRRLPIVDWYRYLTENCDLASAGFILGVAAAYCGSRDGKVTKLLSMHLPSLLPLDSTDLGHSHLTQTTCILGIGLVYMGSCDRRMASVMVDEISRSNDILPEDAAKCHPESRALTAGFALGFITLGQGDNTIGLADLGIKERLFGFMDEKLALPNVPGYNTSKTSSRSNRRINLDVTAPGAMIAIGLMYLKTEDVRIAEKIALPDTLPMLDYIRPDFLLLRVLSRNLIMWSHIKPTEEWIQEQLPDFIANALNDNTIYPQEHGTSYCDMEILQQAASNIIAGCCLSIGLRYAGSRNEEAFRCLLKQFDFFAKRSQSTGKICFLFWFKVRSFELINSAFYNVTASNFQQKITRSLMKACRDIVATAASIVMAGTGNQELWERLSSLHDRIGPDVNYGSHMATHMAAGLLFTGGGKYTLGTSNLAIATLLCSFYPFFPTVADDNMYHLQAFRHLWALALECRWLIPRDIGNDQPCRLPLTVTVFDDDPSIALSARKHRDINVVAPLVVPDFGLIKSIKVDSPRYWPLVINMQEDIRSANNIIHKGILYVKRKQGHETYDADSKGRRSVH
ncbi:hypothetical protein INT44_004070 [Umbelopsis vinacea]|uniref:Anaphase-promoting complex subunit 1 n=1 Tax=Umbelopsis vinacea TaxID=44442 RepID=A0A8H7QAJ9_9FUNG|nr:hypothetical protein INT44_004070 [Umbelopsis vinacea]